jgi:hypothetical protein
MGRIGRLAGALLVETRDAWWLVGNTKEPCDWLAHGFQPPADIDAVKRPYIPLERGDRPSVGSPRDRHPAPDIGEPHLVVEKDGEELAREVARRLLVERNGSVSERLWRLVLGVDDLEQAPRGGVTARWLVEVPEPVWQVVRDAVLRCL